MSIDTLSIVRAHVGRRHKITAAEMAAILQALTDAGLDLRNNHVAATLDLAKPWDPETHDQPQARDAARVWAAMVRGITCINVSARGGLRDGYVRYDQPGSMHPQQHSEIMFAPQGLNDYDYLRRNCDRLLIVEAAQEVEEEPAPATIPAWIRRLRRSARVDGTWSRVHDDGTLELRDPNSGQGSDAARKPRLQYRITEDGDILRRTLPPEVVGDAWADIGVPEWEPVRTPPRDDLIYQWWEAQVQ